MGTQFETADGEVLAKRMSQGKGNPPAFCVFLSETEFAAHKDVRVAPEDNPTDFDALAVWVLVEATRCEVKFMTASDMNRMASDLENHRWAEMFVDHAAEMRQRARAATRDSLSVV